MRFKKWLSIVAVPMALLFIGGLAAPTALAAPTPTTQTIATPTDASGDRFGFAVAVSGDGTVALVGAPGSNPSSSEPGKAYVFTRQGTTWTQQAELTPDPSVPDDFFGGAVALSRDGKVALVGAPGNFLSLTRPGAAFVFKLTDSGWKQQVMLTGAGDPGDFFGFSVALDHGGHKALVGAPNELGDEGAAYVFAQQDGNWPQQARLPDPGRSVLGVSIPAPGDNFGFSVAMPSNGQVALVGADQGGTAGGQPVGAGGFAEIYVQGGGVWTARQQLTGSDELPGDAFGFSVAITSDGNAAVIGAVGKEDFTGAAYTFGALGNTWKQQQEILGSDNGAVSNDLFGYAVTIDDNADIGEISAPFAPGGDSVGDVYRFAGKLGAWSKVLEQIGPVNPSDYGIGLALDHDGFVELVGADGEDNSVGVGAVFAYEF